MWNCIGSFEYVRAQRHLLASPRLTDSQPVVSRDLRGPFLSHGWYDQDLHHVVQSASHWLDIAKVDDSTLYLSLSSSLLHSRGIVPGTFQM